MAPRGPFRNLPKADVETLKCYNVKAVAILGARPVRADMFVVPNTQNTSRAPSTHSASGQPRLHRSATCPKSQHIEIRRCPDWQARQPAAEPDLSQRAAHRDNCACVLECGSPLALSIALRMFGRFRRRLFKLSVSLFSFPLCECAMDWHRARYMVRSAPPVAIPNLAPNYK